MSKEKLSSKESPRTSETSNNDFESFDVEKARQEVAEKLTAIQDEAEKNRYEQEVKRNYQDDPNAPYDRVQKAIKGAESHRQRLKDLHEEKSKVETGILVGIHTERLPFGKVFLPNTPTLDIFISGGGSLSRPIELIPMMEKSSKGEFADPVSKVSTSFKKLDGLYRRGNKTGEWPSQDEIIDLGTMYLVYQEQKQHIRSKKEEQDYDEALEHLGHLIRRGLRSNIPDASEGKIEPDSVIAEAISRNYAKLKEKAFHEASQRRQKKFLEGHGSQEVDSIHRFSKSFSSKDIDEHTGGHWVQNSSRLKALEGSIQAEEEELKLRYGVEA